MNLGFPEMLFLFLLALLLFGPKKLPEIGRQIGRGLAEFKRASNELKGQLENEMRLLEAEDREKTISPPPPPPENTVASSSGTASSSVDSTASAASAATASASDPHPVAGSGASSSVDNTASAASAATASASDPHSVAGSGADGA